MFRGQIPDAKPLPSGPSPSTEAPVVSQNWQRTVPDSVVSAPPGFVGPGPDAAPADCCGGCGNSCGCGGCASGFWSLFHNGACGDNACGNTCGNTCGDACGNGSVCDGACGCGCPPGYSFYASAEYLLWSTRGSILPPLITQGSLGDFNNNLSAGALNLPGTTTLFGGADYNTALRSGGRFMAGLWLGDDHCLAIVGGGLFLSQASASFSATSFNGNPILARPIFDTGHNMATAEFVSNPLRILQGVPNPNPLGGTVAASVHNDFWGAEANLRTNLCCGPCGTLDLIGGYRHLTLDETLSVSESLVGLGAATGFTFVSNDGFAVHNSFNGGQIGLDGEAHFGRWYLDLKAKIAIGTVSEQANLSGSTASSFNGVALPTPATGGLLTAGRVGNYHQDRFAWSPEVGLNLGYNLTDHWRVFVGYDFLYLSNVVRAGDQVNLNVNEAQSVTGTAAGPGSPTPPFAFHTTDFWAQGVNFGLEFRW